MLINIGEKLLSFDIPKIMGILNVTPDSFYDGGKHNQVSLAVSKAGELLNEGADILDLGGYSSRPGAIHISEQEEIDRLLPVITGILEDYPNVLLSVDTFRATVAEAAINAGAHIINDISGGQLDEQMFEMVGKLNVPYILMHMKGTPSTMQQMTDYTDLLQEMILYFSARISQLRDLGVKDIIIDPGFGFAKTLDQNYELLKQINVLKILGLPMMGAVSRKSMIYNLLDANAEKALNGTSVLNAFLLLNGVNLLRVHDVKEAAEVRRLINAVA